MITFFERTWFLWWIVACVIILRWFHLALDQNAETIGSPAEDRWSEESNWPVKFTVQAESVLSEQDPENRATPPIESLHDRAIA